jgi:hypothetical protein
MEPILRNGIYYEIVGGLSEDIINKAEATEANDREAKMEAIDTERCAYRNKYVNGKLVESVRLYDPYGDIYYSVDGDGVYYEPLPPEVRFKYQLLSRLKMDCEYFLGNGNGCERHLWAGNVEDQIAKMRKMYDELKPDWLTIEQIDEYERRMVERR